MRNILKIAEFSPEYRMLRIFDFYIRLEVADIFNQSFFITLNKITLLEQKTLDIRVILLQSIKKLAYFQDTRQDRKCTKLKMSQKYLNIRNIEHF